MLLFQGGPFGEDLAQVPRPGRPGRTVAPSGSPTRTTPSSRADPRRPECAETRIRIGTSLRGPEVPLAIRERLAPRSRCGIGHRRFARRSQPAYVAGANPWCTVNSRCVRSARSFWLMIPAISSHRAASDARIPDLPLPEDTPFRPARLDGVGHIVTIECRIVA